jgi:hypothetical protein
MSSLLGGKLGPFELLQNHCIPTCPLSLQQFMPPLMCPLDVQLWIQARFVQEGWREGHQELLTKLRTQRLCRYTANMRVSCVGGCAVGESAYLAARGPLETAWRHPLRQSWCCSSSSCSGSCTQLVCVVYGLLGVL